jgi:hypothetical protein
MSEPIRWLDWAAPAFEKAEAANTPILLSLVTAWSEECRVMDGTTFSHPDVIAAVSSRFTAIRVDADRHPDVNERYNLGGWPTTALLTSSGELLSGGTYLSADQLITMLQEVADAWRDRSDEIRSRAADKRTANVPTIGPDARPDVSAPAHVRALMVSSFDSVNGGFGVAPKLPHVPALLLALSLTSEEDGTADAELATIVEVTLDRMSALWDPDTGGFYRYADAADWSSPGIEKTLDDHAALLHLYIEAAIRRGSEHFRSRAGEIARWVRTSLADGKDGGFFNARSGASVDRSLYVDRNAQMVGALLRAAAMFEDPWLRDLALHTFESVALPGYSPGGGVAHAPEVRGLLTDQIHVADAAIWAHAVTERLPYSMLAAELVQFSIRTMWDDSASAFRDRANAVDPVHPFQLNCEAACVLDRMASLTGDATFHDRAVAILGALASEYRKRELFGAPYALAIREVIDRRPPASLALTKVDWYLDRD